MSINRTAIISINYTTPPQTLSLAEYQDATPLPRTATETPTKQHSSYRKYEVNSARIQPF
jgi:hypothetical protein